jgi:hypothetical protein
MLLLAHLHIPRIQHVKAMVAMIETWMLMAMPETGVSMAEVAAFAQRLGLLMKRTCFGMLVEGDRDVVREALRELRDLYPGRIIAKRRGFSIEDTKICGRTFSNVAGEDPPWLSRFVCQQKKYSMS